MSYSYVLSKGGDFMMVPIQNRSTYGGISMSTDHDVMGRGHEAAAMLASYTLKGDLVPLESYSQDELLSLMSYLYSFAPLDEHFGPRLRYHFLEDREVFLSATGAPTGIPQRCVDKGLRMPFDRLPLCINAELRSLRGVVMWRLSKLGR